MLDIYQPWKVCNRTTQGPGREKCKKHQNTMLEKNNNNRIEILLMLLVFLCVFVLLKNTSYDFKFKYETNENGTRFQAINKKQQKKANPFDLTMRNLLFWHRSNVMRCPEMTILLLVLQYLIEQLNYSLIFHLLSSTLP